MNVGRLCSIQGVSVLDTHKRGSEYLKIMCARYPGMGFSAHTEWIGEQMVDALRLLLKDTNCTEDERRAVERFLDLAGEELAGAV
jgi:hypothetical protein